jgi:PTS system fructose-specific IIC component
MGVAHTYMAAEALELYAKNNGYDCMVETQGTVGVENKLTSDAIKNADFVIIAADRTVELDRFVGKKLLECTTKQAINKTTDVFSAAENASTYDAKGNNNKSSELKGQNEIMKALMNGVSHMLPLVVVGGLFLGLALMFGGEATSEGMVIPEDTFWYTIQNVGLVGFTLMIPILAGYIAYSIGDRSALAPGLIIGWIANNGSFYNSEASSGFLGAIIGGIMVGYFVKYFSKIRIHKNLQSLMPILIIPLVSTFVTSVAFIYILGKPIAIMFTVLSEFLASMPQEQMILMGALLGFMIAIDMGGPINKTAMLFAIGMIPTAPVFMGINGVAVAVPSIGIGLATIIGRKYFNEEERSAGIASIGMGFAGITEGAIPFAAAHPKQVFPANLIGSMVGGMIAAFFMVENVVPHGGILIAFTGGVNQPLIFILAILIGSLVTALIAVAGMKYKYTKALKV